MDFLSLIVCLDFLWGVFFWFRAGQVRQDLASLSEYARSVITPRQVRSTLARAFQVRSGLLGFNTLYMPGQVIVVF